MDVSTFRSLARPGQRVPVYRRFSADFLTPVQAYLKLRSLHPCSFLLESVVRGEHQGRYSFLGVAPDHLLQTRLPAKGGKGRHFRFFHRLRTLLGTNRSIRVPGLPPFTGGAVGMLGYDIVHELEDLPPSPADSLQMPDAVVGFFNRVVAFDHLKNEVLLMVSQPVGGVDSLTADYRQAQQVLDELENALRRPAPEPPYCEADLDRLQAVPDKSVFLAAVARAKDYIMSGDIFQVVLSRRFWLPYTGDAFAFYRALRNVNPSPYMFYLDFGGFQLIGSSPEALITIEGERAEIVPIAGTRPRGASDAEDAHLAEELRADEKERAEHVMLVDLARNDLSRVCLPGSVEVEDFQIVERYSHVMHLISRVHGRLQPGRTALDALMAAFPAGTVSGAPKIRAMEIIHELEPVKRSFYAGAVGYIDYTGNLDMCITIRSVLARHNQLVFQAGAGIVADSVPEREFEECTNKARALKQAVQLASEGIHDLVHR